MQVDPDREMPLEMLLALRWTRSDDEDDQFENAPFPETIPVSERYL